MASEPVWVKKEDVEDNWSGVSEAAEHAGLYAGHAVKRELVLGPELLQAPHIAYTCREIKTEKDTVKPEPLECYATTACNAAESINNIQPTAGATERVEHHLTTESHENNKNIDREKQSRLKPSQEAMKRRIDLLEKNLDALYFARDTIPNHVEVDKQIIKSRQELNSAKRSLKRMIQNAAAQKKYRDCMKRKLDDICQENPDIKKKLSIRDSVGRPSLEKEQPLLLKAIADIALSGSTDDTRQSESDVIHSAKTLDELTEELQRLGFDISRSATYLRLLPRKSNSSEGRRHVTTVPVKLARAQIDEHTDHIDSNFAETSINYLEMIASILGPDQVFFVTQYDKARVPLGLTAANKEAPLLMHMERRVKLPDHHCVISEQHKLVPSVYAGFKITPGMLGQSQAVTNCGPTYIAIRSGKNSSTANTQAQDFETILGLEEFQPLVRTANGFVKPVVIIISDGAPDENPRYQKVIAFAIQHFKRYDLDALYIATNPPDTSAYNRIEGRLTPLSRELSGLILPRNNFGSHLDELGVTIDDDLEKTNIQLAGNVLAEVWSSVVIDDHRVSAKYVASGELDLPDLSDVNWYSEHVRESQYLLQIVKCKNIDCCRPRSGLFRLLNDRFLPPPIKVKQTANDLIVDDGGQFLNLTVRLALRLNPTRELLQLPYDYFCPTVKKKLSSRTCKTCGLYHACVESLHRHCKEIHGHIHQDTEVEVKPAGNELPREVRTLNEYQDVEWLEESNIDVSKERSEQSHTSEQQASNVIKEMESWIEVSWSGD